MHESALGRSTRRSSGVRPSLRNSGARPTRSVDNSSPWISRRFHSPAHIAELVTATGARNGRPSWTYSDIRTRLYPAALARAYPQGRACVSSI